MAILLNLVKLLPTSIRIYTYKNCDVLRLSCQQMLTLEKLCPNWKSVQSSGNTGYSLFRQWATVRFRGIQRLFEILEIRACHIVPEISSNGEVERAAQTIKIILNKCDDEYLALLTYRNTPLYNPSRRINSESAGLQNRLKKGETVSGHDGTDIQSQTQGRGRRNHSTRRPEYGSPI